MSKYLIFDLETENETVYKRFSSPWYEKNWVVARGWKKQGDPVCSWTYHPTLDRTTTLRIDPDVSLIVGHNIKFDLLWEMCQGNSSLHEFYKRGGKIWCTQYAEYLIGGMHQDVQMVSMDDIIEKYGGRKKIDEVKLLWEAGVKTSEIQEQLLIDYLVGTTEENRNSGDIGNTELIFLGQIKTAIQQGQLKMIQDRMDGLLCTTEMEYRGLKVDVVEAGKRLRVLQADLDAVSKELDAYLPDDLPFEFNWGSPIQKSCFIFGGTVKYKRSDTYIDEATGQLARLKAKETQYVLADGRTTSIAPDSPNGAIVHKKIGYTTYLSGKKKGEYKTKQVTVDGELKTKIQDFFYTFKRQTDPDPSWEGKQTDGAGKPVYGTGADIVEELSLRDIPFLKAMSRKQALDKEIGTYYVKQDKTGKLSGMLTAVQKHDHIIHHKLNHAVTVTSRLSSSEPNLQNLPRGDKSEVKKMFVSHFGEDGIMGEIDYSQLEVVVQGVLSGDEALCAALNQGIDFHCKRVSAKFGVTYEEAVYLCKSEEYANKDPEDAKVWKKRRTGVKEFSFQRAYGAGAKAIAYATGMPIEDVEELIENEDKMFPGIGVFNTLVERAVLMSAVPFNAVNPDTSEWTTYRRGEWYSPTRTRYTFRTHNAPDWMRSRQKDTFSPPELKNYPVQGTGGEFVQSTLGRLWRRFIETDFYGGKALLLNTVHDCVWFDMHKDVYRQVIQEAMEIMQGIPEFYNNRYGMNITVPFPVEAEVGPNMFDLTHFH